MTLRVGALCKMRRLGYSSGLYSCHTGQSGVWGLQGVASASVIEAPPAKPPCWRPVSPRAKQLPQPDLGGQRYDSHKGDGNGTAAQPAKGFGALHEFTERALQGPASKGECGHIIAACPGILGGWALLSYSRTFMSAEQQLIILKKCCRHC